MSSLYVTTALLGLGLAAAIMWLLRRDHLHLSHGVFWLLVAVVAAMLGVWPGIMNQLAVFVGVAYAPSLVLALAAIVLLVKVLHTDILNTRIERQLKRLNQRLSIMELEQQETGKERAGPSKD